MPRITDGGRGSVNPHARIFKGAEVPIDRPLMRECVECGAARYEPCRRKPTKDGVLKYRRRVHDGRWHD